MTHHEKPIREVFADICDAKLTNLEIDAFIKKTTDKFKLPKLKRLIIDYERYIQNERADLLIYFEYTYGDRGKFTKNGTIADEETLNKIIEEYKSKYENAPEIIHSDYDSSSQEITDFSPFMQEFSTEETKHNYYQLISSKNSIGMISKTFFGWKGDLIMSLAPVLMSTAILGSMNSPMFKNTVGGLSRELVNDDFDSENEFILGFRRFLESPVYHFHVKLHTLYTFLRRDHTKHDSYVSEPSTPYQPNSPERKFSPEDCASFFKAEKSTTYNIKDIELVMNYAEKYHHLNNIQAIIREIENDPNYSKIFRGKKVRTTLTRWIHYYDEKNNIIR